MEWSSPDMASDIDLWKLRRPGDHFVVRQLMSYSRVLVLGLQSSCFFYGRHPLKLSPLSHPQQFQLSPLPFAFHPYLLIPSLSFQPLRYYPIVINV